MYARTGYLNSYSPIDLRLRTSRLLSQHTMQAVDSDDEECPELVPVPTATKIPVTIITGFLGRWGAMDALGSRPGAVWLVCRTKAKCLQVVHTHKINAWHSTMGFVSIASMHLGLVKCVATGFCLFRCRQDYPPQLYTD